MSNYQTGIHVSYRLRSVVCVCSLRTRFSWAQQLLRFYNTSMNFVTDVTPGGVCQVNSLIIEYGFVSGPKE